MKPWPLVGRDQELAAIKDALEHDGSAGVVLVGAAGVGKSRLARKAIGRADPDRWSTATVLASQAGRDIPLGAIAPLLPPIEADVDLTVPMLQQAAAALTDRAGDRRLLLVVDDAHLLDDASALLLHQLASSGTISVLMTMRTGETPPSEIDALWKDDLTERLDIGPLSRAHVDELLRAVLGAPVEVSAANKLWQASKGNVLYLRELVIAGQEKGTLVDDVGLWRIVGQILPSPRLTDLVARRLAGTTADDRGTLEFLAFGEPLGLEVLTELAAAETVPALEARGLLECSADAHRTMVRLAHPIHGEVVRDATPLIRANEVRRLLADAIEAHGAKRRGDVLRVAVWRLEGGGPANSELLVDAARQSRFANDRELALLLAERAYGQQPSFASAEVVVDCLYGLGRIDETETTLDDLERMASSADDRAHAALFRAPHLYWQKGRLSEARQLLETVLLELDPDSQRAGEVEGFLAMLEVTGHQPEQGVARAESVVTRSTGRALVQAALAGSLGLPFLGRGADADALANVGLSAYRSIGPQLNMFEPSLLDVGRTLGLAQLGLLAEAAEIGYGAYERATRDGDGAGWAFSAMALGTVTLEQGRLEESLRWWTEAAAVFRAVNHGGPLQWALAGVVFAHALRDEAGLAAEAAEEAETIDHPARMQEVNSRRGSAWLAVAEGDPRKGADRLRDAVELARSTGQRAVELAALHDLARLGHAQEVAHSTTQVAGAVQGRLAAARCRHVHGLAADDLAALGAAADSFHECGANLLAAEAAHDAASEARRTGDQRTATKWARHGNEWGGLCEGAATPGLVTVDGPEPLTEREREVAALAATGRPSQDVADRLFLSVRTVDNHLGRIYAKLGVTRREDLAEVLERG